MSFIELERDEYPLLPKYTPNIPHLVRFEDFKTIDWVNDNLQSNKYKIHNTLQRKKRRKLLTRLFGALRIYVILTAVGFTIGLVTACLNIITLFLSDIRSGYCSNAFYLNREFCCWGETEEDCTHWQPYSTFSPFNHVFFMIISVILAYSSSKLVSSIAPLAAGSGISEIKCIVSGFTYDDFLSFSVFAIKSCGLPLAIASGLAVGKEGPSVHYAVCIGSVISKLFAMKMTTTSNYRNILIAASGAGVAVAFGSPMGGVLFSIEEISNLFNLSTMWESYYCSLVSVSVLNLLNPFRTGQLVMFEVKFDQDWHLFEIPFYIILGLFGGIYGIIISKFNIKVVSFRKKFLLSHALLEVVILATITSLISYFNIFLKLDMTEGMQMLFQTCHDDSDALVCKSSVGFQLFFSLIFATVVRMILIIVTYGCKVPAGIFVPSMACGATFGRALGLIAQYVRRSNPTSSYFTSGCLSDEKYCINPGVYAFLGAGTALSGITHLTVTVVVIMFELTGALKYVIPSMISVAVTKFINDRFGKGGIADQMIEFNGLPFIHPHEDLDFHGHKASDAMTSKIACLKRTGTTFQQVERLLTKNLFQNFPIVESLDDPIIRGLITRDDLNLVISHYKGDLRNKLPCVFSKRERNQLDADFIDFSSKVNHAPISIDLTSSLEVVIQFFHKIGPRCILIEEKGQLRGLLTRKDILRYEYYVHSLEVNNDQIQSELTFQNDNEIWEFLQYAFHYVNDWVHDIFKRIKSRSGYRHIEDS